MGQVYTLAESMTGSNSDPDAALRLGPCTGRSSNPDIGVEPKLWIGNDDCPAGTEG